MLSDYHLDHCNANYVFALSYQGSLPRLLANIVWRNIVMLEIMYLEQSRITKDKH